jgi:hypothetical protein
VVDELVEETGLSVDISLIGEVTGWYPFMYNPETWNVSWNDYINEHELPFRSAVSDQYDYIWGQNIYQLYITYPLLSPGRGGDSTDWVSAAKILGYLEGEGAVYPPHHFGMVLPAFRDVRLIPVPPNVRPPELEGHYNDHLDEYLENGISALDEDGDGESDNDCGYCQLLIYFDDDDFREIGEDWLEDNWEECEAAGIVPGPPSGDETGPPYGH